MLKKFTKKSFKIKSIAFQFYQMSQKRKRPSLYNLTRCKTTIPDVALDACLEKLAALHNLQKGWYLKMHVKNPIHSNFTSTHIQFSQLLYSLISVQDSPFIVEYKEDSLADLCFNVMLAINAPKSAQREKPTSSYTSHFIRQDISRGNAQ